MAGYWKLNTSLFDVKDLQEHLLLTLQLMGTVVGNKSWAILKSSVRSFAVDFSERHNLDRLAVQTTCEVRVDRTIKLGDKWRNSYS